MPSYRVVVDAGGNEVDFRTAAMKEFVDVHKVLDEGFGIDVAHDGGRTRGRSGVNGIRFALGIARQWDGMFYTNKPQK
jgi:hypothetical protein